MEDVLKTIYGSQMTRYVRKDVNLPLYLISGVEFYEVTICSINFVLVKYNVLSRFNISALRKNTNKYYDYFSKNIVYGFSELTTFQRKALIESSISFVSNNGQLFIPFLGSYFEKCQKKNREKAIEKLSPASQMLFLLFLYGGDDFKCSKTEAAARIKISPMSVTRAVRDLTAIGVLNEEKIGNEIFITRSVDINESLLRVKDYLINPVQEFVYIDEYNLSKVKFLKAGEYSLADRSNFGYPKYKEYATIKNDPSLFGLNTYDPDLNIDKVLVKIQKWKYNPLIFGNAENVDPVSLICSFKEETDERIEQCLDEVYGEIIKWQLTMN